MEKLKKEKLDSLARAIVRNPAKGPRHMIASVCESQEDHDYLEQAIEKAEQKAHEAREEMGT